MSGSRFDKFFFEKKRDKLDNLDDDELDGFFEDVEPYVDNYYNLIYHKIYKNVFPPGEKMATAHRICRLAHRRGMQCELRGYLENDDYEVLVYPLKKTKGIMQYGKYH